MTEACWPGPGIILCKYLRNIIERTWTDAMARMGRKDAEDMVGYHWKTGKAQIRRNSDRWNINRAIIIPFNYWFWFKWVCKYPFGSSIKSFTLCPFSNDPQRANKPRIGRMNWLMGNRYITDEGCCLGCRIMSGGTNEIDWHCATWLMGYCCTSTSIAFTHFHPATSVLSFTFT